MQSSPFMIKRKRKAVPKEKHKKKKNKKKKKKEEEREERQNNKNEFQVNYDNSKITVANATKIIARSQRGREFQWKPVTSSWAEITHFSIISAAEHWQSMD